MNFVRIMLELLYNTKHSKNKPFVVFRFFVELKINFLLQGQAEYKLILMKFSQGG